MSNPRDRILAVRTLTAPPAIPTSDTTSPSPPPPPTDRLDVAERRPPTRRPTVSGELIGKPHGHMRSVGLYLPGATAQDLRCLAAEQQIALGEALMNAIEAVPNLASDSRPGRGRSGRRRRLGLINPTTVYVLITDDEARLIAERCAVLSLTVSALATTALDVASIC